MSSTKYRSIFSPYLYPGVFVSIVPSTHVKALLDRKKNHEQPVVESVLEMKDLVTIDGPIEHEDLLDTTLDKIEEKAVEECCRTNPDALNLRNTPTLLQTFDY